MNETTAGSVVVDASGIGEEVADAAITDEVLMAMLEGRSAFYDLLASLYFKPLTSGQIDRIAEADYSVYCDLDDDLAAGLHDMQRYLMKRTTGTRQDLAVDFTAAFAGTSTYGGRYAVPYESVFTNEEGLLFQDSYHELYRLFRRNGVSRSEGFDYPDDHLSFIFEFLSILSGRIGESLMAGDTDGAVKWVALSREMVEKHVLSWFDAFEEMALLILKTRFYRGVMTMTRGFLALDMRILDQLDAMLESR